MNIEKENHVAIIKGVYWDKFGDSRELTGVVQSTTRCNATVRLHKPIQEDNCKQIITVRKTSLQVVETNSVSLRNRKALSSRSIIGLTAPPCRRPPPQDPTIQKRSSTTEFAEGGRKRLKASTKRTSTTGFNNSDDEEYDNNSSKNSDTSTPQQRQPQQQDNMLGNTTKNQPSNGTPSNSIPNNNNNKRAKNNAGFETTAKRYSTERNHDVEQKQEPSDSKNGYGGCKLGGDNVGYDSVLTNKNISADETNDNQISLLKRQSSEATKKHNDEDVTIVAISKESIPKEASNNSTNTIAVQNEKLKSIADQYSKNFEEERKKRQELENKLDVANNQINQYKSDKVKDTRSIEKKDIALKRKDQVINDFRTNLKEKDATIRAQEKTIKIQESEKVAYKVRIQQLTQQNKTDQIIIQQDQIKTQQLTGALESETKRVKTRLQENTDAANAPAEDESPQKRQKKNHNDYPLPKTSPENGMLRELLIEGDWELKESTES